MTRESQPAAVVGSGPNGLAAAVTLARAGVPVAVFESAALPGGGARTEELVRPGVLHDVCSAVHPLAFVSEFFAEFELERRVRFVTPEVSYANPLIGRPAALAHRDLATTAAELGRDGAAYERFFAPLLQELEDVVDLAVGGSMLRWPRNLRATLAAGLRVLERGTPLWRTRFQGAAAQALLTGVAAHAVGRLPNLASAGVATLLGTLAHARGWPIPIGGSQAIVNALVTDLKRHGGTLQRSTPIRDIGELGEYGVVIFDTSARQLARIAASRLPDRYRRALERFRYGDGAAKIDFVLDGPIPWRDPRVGDVPTVHIGGNAASIMAAERQVAAGRHPDTPFVLLAQPSVADHGRNAPSTHAIWSYTHVPAGSTVDVSAAVITQIERFAPGFRDRIVDLRVRTAADLEQHNANYHGGDFSAGAMSVRQLIQRPVVSQDPWRTPGRGIYLCSASTPPGPGVHGLGGWYAACSVLRHEYGLPAPALGLSGPERSA